MDKLGLNFGQLIAFLIPGFVGTCAVAKDVNAINALFGGSGQGQPSSASLVALLLIALAIGIIINAFAWLLVRPLIHLTLEVKPKAIDEMDLKNEDLPIYEHIMESQFRYHQFYSNMLVAVLLLIRLWLATPLQEHVLRDVSFPLVVIVLFCAAQKSLEGAYKRMSRLRQKQMTTDPDLHERS